jgi:hypothetical protein
MKDESPSGVSTITGRGRLPRCPPKNGASSEGKRSKTGRFHTRASKFGPPLLRDVTRSTAGNSAPWMRNPRRGPTEPPDAPIGAPCHAFAPRFPAGATTKSKDRPYAKEADREAAVSMRRRCESRHRSHSRSRGVCVWEDTLRVWVRGTSGSKRSHSASLRCHMLAGLPS